MKTLTLILSCCCLLACGQQTIQEKLGYPKNTILLIIHADDLGVAHSENKASIEVLEKGSVNSASILVPCPWFPEIADYARKHPEADLGIHLALNAEWKHMKWGPVSSLASVPSLVTEESYFPDNTPDVLRNAKLPEVKQELKAQVDRALQFGIDVTHLDSHMGTVLSHPEFGKYYVELGEEYKVPVLVTAGALNSYGIDPATYKGAAVDQVIVASPADYKGGMANFYTKQISDLKPGLHCLLLHAAYNDEETKAMCIDHEDYGAAWRQADYDFFMSEACRKLLAEKKVQLITWREIRDKLYRK